MLAIPCRYARRSPLIDIVAPDPRPCRPDPPPPTDRRFRRRAARRCSRACRNEARKCNDRATIGQPHVSTALDSTRDEKKRESRRLLSNRSPIRRKAAPSRAEHALSAVARDGTGERERGGGRGILFDRIDFRFRFSNVVWDFGSRWL